MSNWGTTSITVTGPQTGRAALHAALAATAAGKLAFSLAGAAPDVWHADGLLRSADMAETDVSLHLKACMAYDSDCLPPAGSLSQRYPALRFEAWFDCEGSWPQFTVALHDQGAEICHAWSEVSHLASLATDTAEPHSYSAVAFYQRTPERDLAASSHLGDCLSLLVRRPEVVAGWRRSDDDPASTVYLMPNADEAGHLVLVLDMLLTSATLLHSVNECGGYQLAESLLLAEARAQLPGLGGEIDRLVLEISASRARYLASMEAQIRGPDDGEVPF